MDDCQHHSDREDREMWKTNNFSQFTIKPEPGSFETDIFMLASIYKLIYTMCGMQQNGVSVLNYSYDKQLLKPGHAISFPCYFLIQNLLSFWL